MTIQEDLEGLLRFATAIGSRYMGESRAGEFGQRNAVPGKHLVRLIAEADVAGYINRVSRRYELAANWAERL